MYLTPRIALVILPLACCSSEGPPLSASTDTFIEATSSLSPHDGCIGVLLASILGEQHRRVSRLPLLTLQALSVEESVEGVVNEVTLEQTARYFMRSCPLGDSDAILNSLDEAFGHPDSTVRFSRELCFNCQVEVAANAVAITSYSRLPSGHARCSPLGFNSKGDRAFIIVLVRSTFYLYQLRLDSDGWRCEARDTIIELV